MFVGFLVAMAVASQHARSSTRCSSDNSEPVGLHARRGRDVRRRRARRPHRRVAAGEGRRARCSRRACSSLLRRHDVLLPHAVQPVPHRRRRAVARPRAARHRAVGRVDDERDQPHRRPRRSGGRHRRDRAAARCSCSPTGCSRRATSTARNIGPLVAIIAVGVCVGFLPFNWQPGEDHHGRRGRAVPRACCSRSRRSRSAAAPTTRSRATRTSSSRRSLIPVVILGVPILDTVFSFVRRLVQAPALASGRRRPPAPPAHAARSRPAPHGRDPVGVDRAAVGRRAACPTYTNEGNALGAVRGRRRSRLLAVRLVPPRRPRSPGSSSSGPRTRTGETRPATAVVDLERAPPQASVTAARELPRFAPKPRFDRSGTFAIDCE